MKRILIPLGMVAAVFVILVLTYQSLQTEPVGRDEPAAVILRAPDGYSVQELGESTLASTAAVLAQADGLQAGARFTELGDTVILLADRSADRVIEMRASRTGTIVERQWQGEVDRRLAWAADHGKLDAPGLPPSTGKNLYH